MESGFFRLLDEEEVDCDSDLRLLSRSEIGQATVIGAASNSAIVTGGSNGSFVCITVDIFGGMTIDGSDQGRYHSALESVTHQHHDATTYSTLTREGKDFIYATAIVDQAQTPALALFPPPFMMTEYQ